MAAFRATEMSAAFSAELTPLAPGTTDAPTTLSFSRWVMSALDTVLAGGSAQAVIATAAVSIQMAAFGILN